MSPSGHTLYYTIDGGSATVVPEIQAGLFDDNYTTPPTGDIVIPNDVTYNGTTYPVTAIGQYAFIRCSGVTSITLPEHLTTIGGYSIRQTAIKSISIPESVTNIGECAFYGCDNLVSVNIPQAVTTLSMGLFYNCHNLPSVVVPEGVDSIASHVFCGCTHLASVNIPNGVKSIEYATFCGCAELTDISIPQGVTRIGTFAFEKCAGLLSVILPDGVAKIDSGAFRRCTNLTAISLPPSVNAIGRDAFRYCSSLKSIAIPEGVTYIAESTFSECSSLVSVTLPETVTHIGYQAFYGCSSLTSITLPESLTTIDAGAFHTCTGMTSMTIPKNVTSIGRMIFEVCPSLESIVVEEGNTVYDSRSNCNAIIETASNNLLVGCQNSVIPKGVTTINFAAFFKCYHLDSISIPEGVTAMYDGAFQESGLSYVTIPSTMEYIDVCVFQGCPNLTTVYCYAENIPETQESTFAQTSLADATLYVPDASIDLYRQTAPWSQFGRIVPLSTTPVNYSFSDERTDDNQIYYDLQGHPCSQPTQRGTIYIHKGNKFVVK